MLTQSATEEGIVYVETEQRDSETASIDQLLIKLQELPQVRDCLHKMHRTPLVVRHPQERLLHSHTQAAPLLKETLTDIHWKDLEALRKIDAGERVYMDGCV